MCASIHINYTLNAPSGKTKPLFGITRPTSTARRGLRATSTPQLLVDIARDNVTALEADELATCIDERRFEDAVVADREIGEQANVDAILTLFANAQKLES